MLCQWTYKQNQWCTSLEHFTLWGTHNIDMKVQRKDRRITAFRKELLRTKDAEGSKPIQMVEHTTYNRMYLVHENITGSWWYRLVLALAIFLRVFFIRKEF